jgi:hypothetical protein
MACRIPLELKELTLEGPRFRTLALVALPLVASPFPSESQVPTFRSTASRQAQATLMPGAASVRKQAPPKLVPR